MSILPILAVEAVSALRRLIARERLWPKGQRMPLCRAIGYTAANIGGVLLMKLLEVLSQSIYLRCIRSGRGWVKRQALALYRRVPHRERIRVRQK
ncbi:MAG: hypothetical protein V8S87_07035 [Oscillospiraceae bacterium]